MFLAVRLVGFGGRDRSPKVITKAFRAGFQRKPSGPLMVVTEKAVRPYHPLPELNARTSLPLIRPRVGIEPDQLDCADHYDGCHVLIVQGGVDGPS